jgi:hypothetical protein
MFIGVPADRALIREALRSRPQVREPIRRVARVASRSAESDPGALGSHASLRRPSWQGDRMCRRVVGLQQTRCDEIFQRALSGSNAQPEVLDSLLD